MSTEQRLLRAGAVLLVVVAAVGNIGHTYDHAVANGQSVAMSWVIAVLPDVLIVLSVLRLRGDLRSAWAWTGVVLAASFVGWASVATARHGVGPKLVSLLPLAVAIVATGMIHVRALKTTVVARAATARPRSTAACTDVAPIVHVVEATAREENAQVTGVHDRVELRAAWRARHGTDEPLEATELARVLGISTKAAAQQLRRWSAQEA